MKGFKDGITILVLSIFFSATINVPVYNNLYAKKSVRSKSKKVRSKRGRKSRLRAKGGDPYAKFSDEELLKMAQKDYNTALRVALQSGTIKSEEEVYTIIAKAGKYKGMTKRAKNALKKRGVNYNPSAFIGKTRAAYIKKQGVDLDKATMADSSGAEEFLKKRSYVPFRDKRRVINTYSEFLRVLEYLMMSTAHARSSTTSGLSRTSAGTASSTSYTTVTTDYATGSSSAAYRMDEEDLAALEDLYDQPSVADSWDQAAASRQKGYKTMSNEIRHKRNIAALAMTAGALLLVAGWMTNKEGQEMMMDKCGPPAKKTKGDFSGKDALAQAERYNAAVERYLKSYASAHAEKQSSLFLPTPGKINNPTPCMPGEGAPGCDDNCNYTGNDTAGQQRKQTGMIMMLAGAGLIVYAMYVFGEVAAMEDEKDEQSKRNADIEKAKQDLLNREKQKQLQKEKIIKYRMRTKQIEEREADERRRRIEEDSSSSR